MVVTSLKGDSPTWGGIGDASSFWPTAGGPFRVLRNFIPSKDGTELRRTPGLAVSGRPDYFDIPEEGHSTFSKASIITKGDNTLTLNRDTRINSTTTTFAYIEDNGDMPDGYYEVNWINAFTVHVLGTVFSGSSATGTISFRRMDVVLPGRPHGIRWVDGYPVVVADVESFPQDGNITVPKRSIAAWVGRELLDWNNPPSRWENWFSTINQNYVTGFGGPAADTHVDFPVRRRCALDVSGDNLLIGAPGVGVCFIVDVSSRRHGLAPIAGVTRALGTPQAAMVSATPTAGPPGGTLTSDATYWVTVGFQSLVTGEIGLVADPVQVTLGPTDTQIDVEFYTPRRTLLECGEYRVIAYISEPDGVNSAGIQPVRQEFAFPTFGTQTIEIVTHLPYSPRVPFFEQMPMGASAVKTIRGTTFFGGMMASIFNEEELYAERVKVIADAAGSLERNTFDFRESAPLLGALCAAQLIPPSVAGIEATINNTRTRILKKVNGLTGAPPSGGVVQRWEFEGQYDTASTGQDRDVVIHMPKGHIWISERGKPGVSPAAGGDGGSGRIIIDRIRGEDVRGFGRLGDAILVMTNTETYRITWGRSPFGADPVLLSDRYGCVARDSIVEYEGGVAWLSEHGPVRSSGGAPSWLAAPISEFWKTVLHDSMGESSNAWGYHDQDRRLVIWGVRTNWNDTIDWPQTLPPGAPVNLNLDDLRSRAPVDELLVWHYDTGVWSTIRFPAGKSFIDMERCLHADEEWHSVMLSGQKRNAAFEGEPIEDHNILTFKEEFGDHVISPIKVEALAVPSIPSANQVWFVGAALDFKLAKVGDHAYIESADGDLLWWGEVAQISAPNYDRVRLNVTDVKSVDWLPGAVMTFRCIHSEMVTEKLQFASKTNKSNLKAVTIRSTTLDPATKAWAVVTVRGEQGIDVPFQDEAWGKRLKRDDLTRFDRGTVHANEHEISITFISDGAVSIKDIEVEAL